MEEGVKIGTFNNINRLYSLIRYQFWIHKASLWKLHLQWLLDSLYYGGGGQRLWNACFNTVLFPACQDMGLGGWGAAGKSPPQPCLIRGCDGRSCAARLPWDEPDSISSLEASWCGSEDNQGRKGEHSLQGPACFNGRIHLCGFLAPFPSGLTPPASTAGWGHLAAAQLAPGLLLSSCFLRYLKCNFILILDEKEWEWQ